MKESRGRYGLLLVAALLSLIVQGALPPSPVQRVAVTVLAAAALLLAFRAARLPRSLIAFAAGLAFAAIAVALVRALTGEVGDGAARAVNALVLVFGPPAVAVGVVRDLRASGEVRLDAVMGALALYLLLGMLFGMVYGVADHVGETAFFAGGQDATVSRCVYFSFSTLTTVGFGDLTAGTAPGRTMAVLEALIGQIYLVTIVSLIVTNLGRSPVQGRFAGRPRGD
jgi:hypothetical protein